MTTSRGGGGEGGGHLGWNMYLRPNSRAEQKHQTAKLRAVSSLWGKNYAFFVVFKVVHGKLCIESCVNEFGSLFRECFIVNAQFWRVVVCDPQNRGW